MAQTIEAPRSTSGSYIQTSSGILLPPSRSSRAFLNTDEGEPGPILQSIISQKIPWYSGNHQGWQEGYRLEKDPEYGFLLLPEKGSGFDDLFSQAYVDGRVANIGISPVVSSQMSAVLLKQQSQARNADILLTGRETPRKKARQAISWYNDSPLGFSGAISQIVYQMRVFNRGAPHSLVPIMAPIDQWDSLGMNLIPIDEGRNLYYLDVDWALAGQPVPYLPSVFDLEPTSDCRWPYWYRVCLSKDKHAWVLLNQAYIFPLHMGHSGQRHIGTCSAYLFWEVLTELSLEKQRRAEMMIHQPTHSLLTVSGISQSASDLKKQVSAERSEGRSQGRQVDKGMTVVTSKDPINAELLKFRESFADFVEFRQAVEDIIAQVFGEPLTSVVTRGNVGFGVQSETSADVNADSGVQSILSDVASVLGAMYPRVTVSIIRPNDYMKRRQLENFKVFADAVSSLPPNTLSPEEIRSMMQNLVVEIPNVEDTGTQSAAPDTSVDQNTTDQVQQSVLFARRLEPITPKGDPPDKNRKPQAKKSKRWDDDFPLLSGMLGAVLDLDDPDHEAEWMLHTKDRSYDYHRPLDDRLVHREEALQLRDDLRELRGTDANDLAKKLADGSISLSQWLVEIQDSVSDAYATSYALGRGGWDQMTDEDFSALNDVLEIPFLVLDDLADRIAEGLYSELQIASFTRNTINGSGIGYELGNASLRGVTRSMLPAWPTEGSECQTNCHCWWSFNYEGNFIVSATWNHPTGYRRIPGVEPCDTCVQRIREYSPYVFPSPIPVGLSIYNLGEDMWKLAKQYNLDDGEIEVAIRLCSGLKISQIARQLGYSEQTIYTRRNEIRKKLGSHSPEVIKRKLNL